MPDDLRQDAAPLSARERLRRLYARLLALPAPAPSLGGPTGPFDGSDHDPFGADLFSERVFDEGERGQVVYGEGFEALASSPLSSGDGHGRPVDAGLSLPPVWALGPVADSSPEVESPVEIEWLRSDTIYGNPKHVAKACDVAVLEESPAPPGLDALPDVPHAGMDQVIVVPFCDVALLNEQLEAGWRVAQMAPAVAPDEMVVVLRFDG